MNEAEPEGRALAALEAAGLEYRITRHGPVRSLPEAATARGIEPSAVIKTLVVRRGAGDHIFVLVPGDREISWPKLRHHLGVNRLSMPDATVAQQVTGYQRGTITPFGSLSRLPVIADAAISGEISLGAGGHGVAATMRADQAFAALRAERADVSEPVAKS